MVINMLNADYEQAYVSTFAKIFAILKEEYEVNVIPGEEENYEVEIKSINHMEVSEYLSICFQKQNGSLTIVASKKINDELIEKLVRDIALAINENPVASYNFKDLKDYVIYHFSYVKENVLIDNKKIIDDLKASNQIENLNYNLSFIDEYKI